jgi:hypothetical protein
MKYMSAKCFHEHNFVNFILITVCSWGGNMTKEASDVRYIEYIININAVVKRHEMYINELMMLINNT